MTLIRLPLNSTLYTDVNGVECRDLSSELRDGYLNELGHTVKRPGTSAFVTLLAESPGVDGIHYSRTYDCCYAVHNSVIYKVIYNGETATAAALTTPAGLIQDRPCYFVPVWVSATQSEVILVANGDKILVIDGRSDTVSAVTDASVPSNVTQLTVADRYVIAVTTGPYFYYSYPGQYSTWYGYTLPDTNTDLAVAIKSLKGEAFIFGTESTEIWQASGDSDVFERVDGGTEEVGCLAKDSVIIAPPDQIYWLSNNGQYARWNGSGIELLNCPYDTEMEGYQDTDRCVGSYVKVGGQQFVLFRYIGEDVTHCLNLKNDEWSKWGGWNSAEAKYKAFPYSCSCYWGKWGICLLGSTESGAIHLLSATNYTDVGGDIRFYRKTGALDLGTTERKESRDFKIRLNRGTVVTTNEPKLAIRWKDDGKNLRNEKLYSLGNYGQSECQIRGFRNGIYHSRQWEIYTTDPVPLVIVEAYENVEVL